MIAHDYTRRTLIIPTCVCSSSYYGDEKLDEDFTHTEGHHSAAVGLAVLARTCLWILTPLTHTRNEMQYPTEMNETGDGHKDPSTDMIQRTNPTPHYTTGAGVFSFELLECSSISHLVEVKEDHDESVQVKSWAFIQRKQRPSHLASVGVGGFVVARAGEPTGQVHPSASRQVMLAEERLAFVSQCLEVDCGSSTAWVVQVISLVFVGQDDRSGCTVWQLGAVPEYISLSQIHRTTHCVHLCGAGCSADIGSPGHPTLASVHGEQAVGLVGVHDDNGNPFYLLNEHFLR